MKIMIASDIHGSSFYLRKLEDAVNREKPDKLVLLGDYLYHGARNGLPVEYDPQIAYDILNGMKDIIIAIRGNCDAEIDQTVLDFPISDDYKILEVDGIKWYLTHGHVNERLPEIGSDDILFNGHTHKYELSRNFINPGSVSIPRGNPEHTYIVYEKGVFTLHDVDGKTLTELSIW